MSDFVSLGTLQLAQLQVDILLRFIDHTTPSIKIHINSKQQPDYSRMMFILFSLARGVKYELLSKEQQENLTVIFWKLYNTATTTLPPRMMQYVDLYGMRFLNSLKQDYSVLIKSFSERSHEELFTYPVLTYIYVSAYFECPLLSRQYPFATSLKQEAFKNFDWLLRSDAHKLYLPFHFAELSAWDNDDATQFKNLAYQYIDTCFENGYLSNSTISASGVAKCMEDFSRRGLQERFQECRVFLQQRELARFKDYVRPDQKDIASQLYTETLDTQYVCLDTNAHLLNSYLNAYERLPVS